MVEEFFPEKPTFNFGSEEPVEIPTFNFGEEPVEIPTFNFGSEKPFEEPVEIPTFNFGSEDPFNLVNPVSSGSEKPFNFSFPEIPVSFGVGVNRKTF